jgi:hypothetical protein
VQNKPRRGEENDAGQMRNEMTESEQLERDAERIRARLAETLVELRSLLTPGHAVNRILDLGSDSTALAFLRNLRDKTLSNPLALGIVSAGMAWLMFSSGREGNGRNGTPDRAQGRIDDAAESDLMAGDREELKTTIQEQDQKIKSLDALDEWSSHSLSNQPSIVPSGMEGELRDHRTPTYPEQMKPLHKHD